MFLSFFGRRAFVAVAAAARAMPAAPQPLQQWRTASSSVAAIEPMYETEPRALYGQFRPVLWQLYAALCPDGRAALRPCLDIEILAGLPWFARRRRGDGIYITPPGTRARVDRTGISQRRARPSWRWRGVRQLEKLTKQVVADPRPGHHAVPTAGMGPRASSVISYGCKPGEQAGANLQGGQLLPWDGQTPTELHVVHHCCRGAPA